jgi:cytoskeletal protein CcmA (bactofilin family)
MFIKFKNQQGKENLSDGQIDADIAPEMAETSQLSSSEVLNLRPTIISEGSAFDGNLTYKGSVHLDGKFKGIIKADKVIMGKNGSFNGTMVANQVTISGNVKGEVQSQLLSIKTGAKVSARLEYEQIEIQYGANLIGEMLCVKK